MSTAVVTPEPIVTFAPTRPVEVQPHLQQVSRGYVSIVSIWPAKLKATRRHNGITSYEMAAAPRGSYSKLVVYDTQSWIVGVDESASLSNRKTVQTLTPMPIPAAVVAQDLVNWWGGDTLGARSGFKPGIGMIAGDDPTPSELAALQTSQEALFNWFITDAMGKHMQGLGVEISDTHRMAAKYMLDRGAERLPWFPTVEFAAVKDCVACGKQIHQNALRCEHCTTMLPQFYMEYGITPENDPAVSDFIARIKAGKEKTVETPKTVEPPIKIQAKQ